MNKIPTAKPQPPKLATWRDYFSHPSVVVTRAEMRMYVDLMLRTHIDKAHGGQATTLIPETPPTPWARIKAWFRRKPRVVT